MTLLNVTGISKQFQPGQYAVDNVAFSIQESEILCLLGPSGCGKTTLLRIISGLEPPDQGKIAFEGRDVMVIPPYKRDFGMMFQDFALFPHKNVFDNIAFGLKMHNQSQGSIKGRVDEMLDLVDLEGFADREIDQLSGGEQQRVALARALAPSPRLLMLDEPLGSLDRALHEKLMLDLRQILKQVGVTAIYVTHDQTEAFAIADRVAVMNLGKIEQIASPEELYYQPETSFVAQFLGLTNLIEGILIEKDSIRTELGDLRFYPPTNSKNDDVMLLIRPEAGRILDKGDEAFANTFEAQLKMLSFRGRFYQAWIDVNGTELMLEFARIDKEPGDIFPLMLQPSSLLPLPA